MKKLALDLMRVTGAFAPFRMANRDKALVLMYHRFGESEDGAATSARAFDAHLAYLTSHYRVVPLSQIAGYILAGKALPRGLAAITIDDGYGDAYRVALPLLRRYDVQATLFVVTDFLDGKAWMWTDKLKFLTRHTTKNWLRLALDDRLTGIELNGARSRRLAATHVNALLKRLPDEIKEQTICKLADSLGVALPDAPPDEFAPLSWDEARALDAAGVEIGSHTVTHPILTRVNPSRLRREISDSKARLEEMLGREVSLFCYPNGDYDEAAVAEVERAGYRCAVTTDYGMNTHITAPLRLRRVAAESDLSRFVQSTSGFEGAKFKLRASRFFAADRQVAATVRANGM